MGDSREEILDLDLNLEPSVPLSPGLNPDLESLSSDIGYMEERIRELEAVTIRDRHRWRWWQGRLPHEPRNISMQLILNPGREMGLQNGEGSVASEESTTAGIKACKVNARDLVAKALEKDEDAEKGSSCGASFFECNICLDVAKNPVLTCCGHLYCWSCLYRWIHIHSDTKECPVCKGEVTDKNITPIYGRDNDKNETDKEDESGVKIPPRPHAHRVESLRQIIHRAVQIEDSYLSQMISRIGSRIDVLRERSSTTQDLAGASETPDRPSTLANRILTARGGIRREGSGRYPFLEQNVIRPEQDIVDLTQGSTGSSEAEGSRRPSLRVLRSQSQRAASISQLSSYLNSAERLVQAYFHRRPFRRNHAPSPQVENRDSVSSITSAGIHSESQSRDSAIEIDSLMALLPSSSRRRTDASRASDVDSGVSRAPRRRRFN